MNKKMFAIFSAAVLFAGSIAASSWEIDPALPVKEVQTAFGQGWNFSSKVKTTQTIRKKIDLSGLAGKNVIIDGTMRFDKLDGKNDKIDGRMRIGKSDGFAFVALEYTKADGKKHTFYLRKARYAGTDSLPWIRCVREHRIPAGAKDGFLVAGISDASGAATFVNLRVFEDKPLSETKVEIRDGSKFTKCVFPHGILAFRRNNKLIFKFQLLDDTVFTPTAEEKARGFVPFRPEEVREVAPGRKIRRSEVLNELKVKSTPGQGQELFLAVGSLRNFKAVKVSVSTLKRADGKALPDSIFDLREAEIMRIMWGRDYYRTVPRPQYPMRPVAASPEHPRLFNLITRLPENAEAGIYRGTVTITADDSKMELPLTFEVLPFKLVTGKPYMFCYYHKPELKYYADMVDHGANSVYLGDAKVSANIKDGKLVMNYDIPDAHIECYRKSGMSKKIVFNPFHDRLASRVLELLGLHKNYKTIRAYGEPHYVVPEGKYPAEAAKLYKEIVREMFAHMKEKNYPDYLLHMMDEPAFPVDRTIDETNAWRFRGWFTKMELGFCKEVNPQVRTFSTAYKLLTIEQLRPELDVGCAEIERITREEAINYRRTVHNWGQPFWGMDWPAWWDDYCRTRRAAGFIPAETKLDAFMIWVYYISHLHDPEYIADDFHGGYQMANYSYHDKEGNLLPTVVFEGIRAGANDWRYVETLREMLKAMPSVDYWQETRLLDDLLASNKSSDEKREWVIQRILLLKGKGK